jgi:hypothetical protein
MVSCDQIALREIMLLEQSWPKGTQIGTIFKKFIVKTTFKLKINIIRNPMRTSADLSNLVRISL